MTHQQGEREHLVVVERELRAQGIRQWRIQRTRGGHIKVIWHVGRKACCVVFSGGSGSPRAIKNTRADTRREIARVAS